MHLYSLTIFAVSMMVTIIKQSLNEFHRKRHVTLRRALVTQDSGGSIPAPKALLSVTLEDEHKSQARHALLRASQKRRAVNVGQSNA